MSLKQPFRSQTSLNWLSRFISLLYNLAKVAIFPNASYPTNELYFLFQRRSALHNDYGHRKWQQELGFQSWTRLFASQFVIIPLEKSGIHPAPSQLLVNRFSCLSLVTRSRNLTTLLLRLKIDLVSQLLVVEWLICARAYVCVCVFTQVNFQLKQMIWKKIRVEIEKLRIDF